MGKIIAVVSGKGGTGKTSFTANTGLALASLDQRVLCMDCDITLRNLDLALGLSDRRGDPREIPVAGPAGRTHG